MRPSDHWPGPTTIAHPEPDNAWTIPPPAAGVGSPESGGGARAATWSSG
ncbi:hypothetical protein [Kitasatospora sp. NPDC087315]